MGSHLSPIPNIPLSQGGRPPKLYPVQGWGLGRRVQGSWFGDVWGLGCVVRSLGFRV